MCIVGYGHGMSTQFIIVFKNIANHRVQIVIYGCIFYFKLNDNKLFIKISCEICLGMQIGIFYIQNTKIGTNMLELRPGCSAKLLFVVFWETEPLRPRLFRTLFITIYYLLF